jgi:hypothetical protein
VSEDKEELGAALTRLVAAFERVSLNGLQPGDRDLVEQALLAARAALDRLRPERNHFPRSTEDGSGVWGGGPSRPKGGGVSRGRRLQICRSKGVATQG